MAHDHDHGAHAHDHGHGGHDHGAHAGHSHGVSADADRRWLALALGLIASFAVVEVVAGLVSGSVALISDAAHMVTDAAAIGLALVALRLAARPPGGRFTFGLRRTEVLSAQLNGAALLVLAGFLALEAVRRLVGPPEVEGGVVIVTGVIGAVVNVGAAAALAHADRSSMNVRGAYLHVLTDLYASLAAIVAGVVIAATGFLQADAIAALAVCALMLHAGWGLLRDASRVLLDAAPAGVDPDEVGRTLVGQPGVVEVHDLHVWDVTPDFPALAAHITVGPGEDCHARRRELSRLLGDRFGIEHVTLQVEHATDQERLLELTDTRSTTS